MFKKTVIIILLVFISFYSKSQHSYIKYNKLRKYSNNSGLVKEAVNEIQKRSDTYSFLIYKNNFLVVESYFNNFQKGDQGNLKSASKSILSALVGIAIEKGFIENIDKTLYEYISAYFTDSVSDWKKNITIRHLLSMSSGLETTSGSNYFEWVASDNWIEYALSREKVSNPGELFSYSTGDSHLLSALLTKATGMGTLEFAQEYLFDKMNIKIGYWQQDPQGYYLGGNNLFLSPTELGEFGKLYLNKGQYNNQQIVLQDWVNESTSLMTKFPQNDSIKFFFDNIRMLGYGYYWWHIKISKYDCISALGFGNQILMIINELDLVIVVTSDWDISDQQRLIFTTKIIRDKIIPAFNKQ